MPHTSYLHLKNGRYYVRIRTPQPLLPWLGQKEIRWSLGTGCLKTARQHLLIATTQIHLLFERVSMEIAHAPLSDKEKYQLKNKIEQIKLDMLKEFRAMLAAGPRGVTAAKALLESEQIQFDAYESALDAGHYDAPAVKWPASDLIPVVPRLAYDFSALNPNYDWLAHAFCSSMVQLHRTRQHALSQASEGELAAQASDPTPRPIVINHYHPAAAQAPTPTAAPIPDPAPQAKPPVRIASVVAAYIEEQKAQGNLAKTIQEYEGVLGKFVDFTQDALVQDIKISTIKDFRESLKKYPARPTQAQRQEGYQSLIEAQHEATLGVGTINKHLGRISQLCHWAAKNDYDLRADLAEGLNLKDRRRARDQRDRYDQEELDLLFSTPDYQGTKKFARAAYYWVPLIGLYSGMRIEEICQLRAQDIRTDKDSGTVYFDVNDEDEDRKLKPGEFTQRIIPIHSKLQELGFLDYVSLIKERRHRMLFPTLTRHEMNGHSHGVTKWFSKHKTALDLGEKLTFHSLRHTVADTLKQSGVEEAHMNAIMGHTGGSMSITRYGKDYKPDVLVPAIEKLTFTVPAKPYKECGLFDAEKTALRSPAQAQQLKDKRVADQTKRQAANAQAEPGK